MITIGTNKTNIYSNNEQTLFCLDINECSHRADRCSKNTHCVNTEGSYTCSCNSGFHGDGMSCSDIDECEWGVHDCHQKATCLNTIGSFRCSCLNGYHGDGKQCQGKQIIQVQLRYLMECVHCHAMNQPIAVSDHFTLPVYYLDT